jgi:hypothetical protein
MRLYEVCFIFTRCFVQKPIELRPGVKIVPLTPTGSSGDIHDARRLLEQSGFSFSRKTLDATLDNFKSTGQSLAIRFADIQATNYINAIEKMESESETVVGAFAVIAANPAIPLCAFSRSAHDSGLKFYVPPDRIIRHGTNVPGFLDALPDIEKRARSDAKIALLLRLYRASLREREIDNQILFQLILFEEASDNESGTFAERLRTFSDKNGFSGDLAVIAAECGLTLPQGKDVIDVLVKLRNAAAHNGKIDEASLREYSGEWILPLLDDKIKLHKVISEAIRYMFCCLVGHTRDAKALKITGNFEIKFD